MTIKPKIENYYDFGIKNRKYSQYKLLKEFFSLPCEKTKENLYSFLHTCLGLNARPKIILNTLIPTWENEELIKISHNGKIELIDSFPKHLENLHKAIEKFQKERDDYFNRFLNTPHSPMPNKELKDVNGDENK